MLLIGKGKTEGPGRGPSGADPVALTSGGLEPLLLHTVADLSLGVTFRQVTGDHGCVPFVHLDHMLAVKLEIFEICREQTTGHGWLAQHLSVSSSFPCGPRDVSLWCRQRTAPSPAVRETGLVSQLCFFSPPPYYKMGNLKHSFWRNLLLHSWETGCEKSWLKSERRANLLQH